MKIQEARELGDQLANLISLQQYEAACELLFPQLAQRTPFRLLDVIGEHLGNGPPKQVNLFLDQVAAQRTMGGWVVIASTLRQQLTHDLPAVFERCQKNCHCGGCVVCLRHLWRACPRPSPGGAV